MKLKSNNAILSTAARQYALFFLLCLAPSVSAFRSMAALFPNNNGKVTIADNDKTRPTNTAATTTSSSSSSPWRVVLDIGREPLSTTMPFDWARSGGRMPVKIPVDFSRQDGQEEASSLVQPHSDTVSFTGPEGAVSRPIRGGTYQVTRRNNINNNKNDDHYSVITFDLTFPETLARRDVVIPAGTTISCTSRLYTQEDLDALSQAFYDARDAAWQLGGELNAMTTTVDKHGGPPKVWNDKTNQWEPRVRPKVNPLQWAQKRLAYAVAKAKQNAAHQQRPNPQNLSARGRLHLAGFGKDDASVVYVAKDGVARTQSGAVIGKWSMEPILF